MQKFEMITRLDYNTDFNQTDWEQIICTENSDVI